MIIIYSKDRRVYNSIIQAFLVILTKQNDKSIKNIFKIAVYTATALISILLLLYFILLLPTVQTGVINYITKQISNKLQTEVSIGHISFRPIKSLVLEDVVVYDQNRDTLFRVKSVETSIKRVSFYNKSLEIGTFNIDEPLINIAKIDSSYNFSFLLNLSPENEKKPTDWSFIIRSFQIDKGTAHYTDSQIEKPISIEINNLNTWISNIKTDSLTSFIIERLQFDEGSGFKIKNTIGKAYLKKDKISISSFNIESNHSNLKLDSLSIDINAFENPTPPIKYFYLDLGKSLLSPNDLSYFVDMAQYSKIPLTVSGLFKGNIGNIKGNDVLLEFGNESFISTNFDINGLPNISETFLFLDITQLKTNPLDLQKILNLTTNNTFQLPSNFQNLEYISYKGNITGFLTDLVAYGRFKTPLGSIKTDVSLKFDKNNRLIFNGEVATSQFNIGPLSNRPANIGKVTMKASINGYRQTADSFNVFLKGNIDSLSINNYQYKNIKLNGLLAKHKFDGEFLVNDPNGLISFEGKLDYSKVVPNFNFKVVFYELKLDKLQLVKDIPNCTFSAEIQSNFEGKSINDLVGYLHIKEAKFTSPIHDVRMDSLSLISVREGLKKHVVLQSDLMEGELVGNYNFTKIGGLLLQNLYLHAPSLAPLNQQPTTEEKNDFVFSLQFKSINKLANLLNAKVDVSDRGLILGKFNTEKHQIDLEGEFEYFNYGNIKVDKPELHINTNSDKLSIITQLKTLKINNVLTFKNLSIHQLAHNDSITQNVFWNSWDKKNNSGSIFTKTSLKLVNHDLIASIKIEPSYIMINERLWEIDPTQINYSPQTTTIKNFKIHHENQQIAVNGALHKDGNDGMDFHIENFVLEDLLAYQNLSYLNASGLINGDISIENAYQTPIITSNINISDFTFNKDLVGDFYLKSGYLNDIKSLLVETSIKKNNYYPLSGGGLIDLHHQTFDLDFDLNKLEVGFLNMFLSHILQNLSGTASGKLGIKGPISAPQLIGSVNVDKAFCDIGLLKTSYSVSDSIRFTAHEIQFRSMTVTDSYGHKGKFRGVIKHEGFRNMSYDLTVEAYNMLVLNTKRTDNPLYYGTAFATGKLDITGTTSDLVIDINAKTMENTDFYIPLKDEESANENQFIRFKSNKTQKTNYYQPKEKQYEANTSGFSINMNIEITPVAKTQVIFDSKTGDILKGRGNGSLQIKMDKNSHINFYGNYNFEDGDYLFTLQNVINKNFIINSGSTVTWDGDPYDAIIDLTATYKAKTSLYDLFPSYANDGSNVNDEYKRRIPINCNMILTDRLLKPTIRFEIKSPSTQQNYQDIIDAYVNTDEDKNKQVLSLLILNRFYAPDQSQSNANKPQKNNAALVTTTDVLSNQLSHWLSQINDDIDIGISYRPGDEVTDEEMEVALSTQFFNNRVSVNGNVGYARDQTQTSNIIGDFDMDVKLNKSGKIRAKAYTHTNNDVIYQTSPYTQGVGLSFREEFDFFSELMQRYWLRLKGPTKADTLNVTPKK